MYGASGSEDHRGTPEAPGRVVTLIERSFWETLIDHHASAEEKVWGVAYRISQSKIAEVQAYLDVREINGYSIHYTAFYPASSSTETGVIKTMVYIGTPENPQFLGPQDPEKLAERILRSNGPSGENREYLFELAESLDQLSPESGDKHVKDLSARVRALEYGTGGVASEAQEMADTDGLAKITRFHSSQSTDEQEEVEKV